MGKKLLLCDSLIGKREQYDLIVNFNYSSNENEFSIPKIIEENADNFKSMYLDWVYKLGRENLNGKTVIDQLSIRKDFSFWWTTLIFEKSKWKSPGIFKSFQLMALFSILERFDDISSIDISLSDKNIQKSILEWSTKNNVIINIIDNQSKKINYFSLNNLFDSSPHFIRAIIWLINYSFRRWPRNRYRYKPNLNSKKDNLLILSYFLNIDKKQVKNNAFRTGYWTSLHDLLPEINKKVNWLHMFVKSNDYSSIKDANYLLNDFNKNNMSSDSHSLLDNSLCFGVIIGTLKDYLKIVFIGYRMKNIKQYFEIENTKINLWNYLCFDWNCSIFGKTAIANCLYLNLFEKAFNEIPTQSKALYLLENQAWEKCMLYAWHKNNHGSIIGVQHTTVSFWDLRHFFNINEYKKLGLHKMPIPDKFALNGPISANMYAKNHIAENKIVDVEALRYLHLDYSSRKDNNLAIQENTLLVLGDIDPIITFNQMQLLSRALRMITFSLNIIVKPHPMCAISEKQFPDINFKIVSNSLENLRKSYSIAFTSNPTAASLDVYLSGKKVIIMLDSNSFNMSPLRGYKDVDFITTEEELSNKISQVNNIKNYPKNNFFYIDLMLPRWNKLLNFFN
jgi:surface carbohydrate biosynthesis protein (TIGR04326 family)